MRVCAVRDGPPYNDKTVVGTESLVCILLDAYIRAAILWIVDLFWLSATNTIMYLNSSFFTSLPRSVFTPSSYSLAFRVYLSVFFTRISRFLSIFFTSVPCFVSVFFYPRSAFFSPSSSLSFRVMAFFLARPLAYYTSEAL